MTTGIELIARERAEQIKKHGRTPDRDIQENSNYQLHQGALKLLRLDRIPPENWDIKLWDRMVSKPYKDRLIIAGALISGEIDRLISIG